MYSPELNPDELLWNHVKHHRQARAVFSTREGLKGQALSWLHALQKLPQLIQSFFRHRKLSYITIRCQDPFVMINISAQSRQSLCVVI